MNDILRLLSIVILLTISLAAYFLVIGTLFTARMEKTQRVINAMPGRALGVGLVNVLFFGVIAVVLFSIAESANGFLKGILTIPALVIAALLMILLSLGLTGMVNSFSTKLFADVILWRRNLWGAVILCLASALPFVGWLLLFPYLGFVGVGAVILSFFQREHT